MSLPLGIGSQTPSVDVACTHCGLPVPAGLMKAQAVDQFCCSGCRVVFAAIRSHGLERYYCVQAALPGERLPAHPTGRKFIELDNPELLEAHSTRVAPGLRAVELFLEGVHCSACVWLVEKLPRVAPGVIESRLDLGRALVRVVWDEEQIQLSQVAQALDSLGYTPHLGRDATSRELRQRDDRKLLIKIAMAGAGAGNVMLLAFALYGGSFHGMDLEYTALFRWMSLAIGLLVILGPGYLFFRGAIAALRTRTSHLDLPIAIGLSAGAFAGAVNTIRGQGEIYFDSLTGLVFLLLVGRYIQRRLEQRATEAVERLFSFTPSFARIVTDGTTREVPIATLAIGQVVEVRPGESLPADGAIVRGSSCVDLSLLTGESRPIAVGDRDLVFAGAINLEHPILVRISGLGRNTRVGKLLALMQECAQGRAPIVRLADRFAGYFTVAALSLFVLTLLGWHFIDPTRAVEHAVTLLVVSCPCGLGLATPFAVSVALGRAARASILVKGGAVLEALAASRTARPTIFLDKTGTLTDPGLEVIEWHGEADMGQRLGPAIAALESKVNHPIAHALTRIAARSETLLPVAGREPREVVLTKASRDGIEGRVEGARCLVGSESFVVSRLSETQPGALHSLQPEWALDASRNLAERCHTPVWVALNASIVAVIGVGSRIREDAASTISLLRKRGLEVAMLSGDAVHTVSAVGRHLGLRVEDCHGGLLPEEKVRLVREALVRGPVFMVGDGVNDAAALSAATVGIAVQGGAEASLAAADVYLGRAGIDVLVELFDGSRRTIRVIRRCLIISLAYNVVAAALAVSGSINALMAAVLMPLASFTVLAMALASRTFDAKRARRTAEASRMVSHVAPLREATAWK